MSKHLRRRIASLMAATCGVLLLAACGGGDSDPAAVADHVIGNFFQRGEPFTPATTDYATVDLEDDVIFGMRAPIETRGADPVRSAGGALADVLTGTFGGFGLPEGTRSPGEVAAAFSAAVAAGDVDLRSRRQAGGFTGPSGANWTVSSGDDGAIVLRSASRQAGDALTLDLIAQISLYLSETDLNLLVSLSGAMHMPEVVDIDMDVNLNLTGTQINSDSAAVDGRLRFGMDLAVLDNEAAARQFEGLPELPDLGQLGSVRYVNATDLSAAGVPATESVVANYDGAETTTVPMSGGNYWVYRRIVGSAVMPWDEEELGTISGSYVSESSAGYRATIDLAEDGTVTGEVRAPDGALVATISGNALEEEGILVEYANGDVVEMELDLPIAVLLLLGF